MSLRGGEHPRSFLNLLFEVALITAGVFLALWANNWHEDRRASRAGPGRAAEFRRRNGSESPGHGAQSPISRNPRARAERISQEQRAGDRRTLHKSVHFEGLRPVIFEHTAWDLALATQAFSWLTPDLAFDISKVYTQQNALQQLQDSFLSAAFSPASLSGDNLKGLATAMEIYLIDVNQLEPAMVSRYEKIIPEVKRALSGEAR